MLRVYGQYNMFTLTMLTVRRFVMRMSPGVSIAVSPRPRYRVSLTRHPLHPMAQQISHVTSLTKSANKILILNWFIFGSTSQKDQLWARIESTSRVSSVTTTHYTLSIQWYIYDIWCNHKHCLYPVRYMFSLCCARHTNITEINPFSAGIWRL